MLLLLSLGPLGLSMLWATGLHSVALLMKSPPAIELRTSVWSSSESNYYTICFCQVLPYAMPLGNPSVTTNVPMDGNDPRGGGDWQWAERDQELKVSKESRGLSEEHEYKHVVKHVHNISMALDVTWEPPQPKAMPVVIPPWTVGAGHTWGPRRSWVTLCYLMPGLAVLGTDQVWAQPWD